MKYDVQILSLAFKTPKSEEELVSLISSNISQGLDIVILPETCTGATKTPPHKLDEGFVKTIAGLALEYSTYVLLPLFIQRDGKRYNTTLLYDRSGKLVFSYDKQYPFWAEYDLIPPVTPGKTITTYEADPSAATAARSVVGIALVGAAAVMWIRRRDGWGVKIRAFFEAGREQKAATT